MNKHKHNWRIVKRWTGGVVAECGICENTMGVMQVNRYLNAVEELSAGAARGAAEACDIQLLSTTADSLHAYASMLDQLKA